MSAFAGWFVASCWGLFLAIIIVSAFSAKRTLETDRRWIGGWFGFTVLALALLFFGHSVTLPAYVTGMMLWPRTLFANVIADAMVVAGLLVALWGRATLGRNWNLYPSLQEHHELIERGPYAYVRHPMYSGLVLMLLGTVIWYGAAIGFIFFVACLFGTWLKWRREEKILTKRFGSSYLNYKARVKALVPFVW